MNSETIESMVRDVLEKMNSQQGSAPAPSSAPTSSKTATVNDYPLASVHPDWVKTPTGKTAADITVENVLNGSVTNEDMRITPEVLRTQAEIARDAGRELLALNFERAAELTAVPDEKVLDIYNALRPYRSTKQELLDIAQELDSKYQATICAEFVREAAELYQQRKKLQGDN
ncbi:propanediol dehydratase small subunit PduE [Vibrio sp. TH_r3]|uniref:propanediol dehydratase small subunit PduE n=1 Tax=unclassified Vibrio TaxID=2614977 RepID=UPI00295458C4|nr:propanediol dehydratase small subunit PduE [Vibrio sp. TH_r3]MDV7103682.1 propanediol dehydratase small subunit PduE [Vibrio sp. TH_r3]